MLLALTGNDGLFQLFGLLHEESLVHFLDIIQNLTQFFIVRGVFGSHRSTELGFRISRGCQGIVRIFGRVQCVLREHTLQFDGAHNVTCTSLLHLFAVFTGHTNQLGDTLFGAVGSINHIHTQSHLTIVNLHHGHLTQMRLHIHLEDKRRQRLG